MVYPFVSVIIPAHNDAERLVRCLRALEGQTYPTHLYEVIVVDNASDEPIAPALSAYPHARGAYEAQRGSYAARNTGIAVARGEVLAFTDSDCLPAPDWLEQGVAALLGAEHCGGVGGRIEFFFHAPEAPTIVELYDSVMHLDQEEFIRKKQFSVTANLFTFEQVVEQVGLFDSTLESNGDKDWGQRVAARGYRLVYAADACVRHPARRTFRELQRKVTRVVKGAADLQENRRVSGQSTQIRSRWSLPVLKILRLRNTYHLTLWQQTQLFGIWLIMKSIKASVLMRGLFRR